MYYKIFNVLVLLLLFTSKSYADNERFVLEDRKVKNVGIMLFTAKDPVLAKKVTEKFLILLSQNKSEIKFTMIEKENNLVDSILTGELKEYNSEIKSNTIADAYNYDILEQQVKIGIEIEVKETQNNDLIWRRKTSKYSTQSWLDFVRSRIGDNNVVDYFYVPFQLSTGLKKQYSEEEFIDRTISDVVKDLSTNLVKLK